MPPAEHSLTSLSATDETVRSPGIFATTHWSVVLEAQGESPAAQKALEKLCHTYWRPIYGYVRRHGVGTEDAEDLTQGFFALLLERKDLNSVRKEKGRLRSYLLASVKHLHAPRGRHHHPLRRGLREVAGPPAPAAHLRRREAERRDGRDGGARPAQPRGSRDRARSPRTGRFSLHRRRSSSPGLIGLLGEGEGGVWLGHPSSPQSARVPRLAALPRPPVSRLLWGRMTDSDRDQTKPTAKQLRYLRNLAASRGESFAYPRTRAQASEEIVRLKGRHKTPAAERRREERAVRDRVAAGTTDAATIRDEETSGYGSSAGWQH